MTATTDPPDLATHPTGSTAFRSRAASPPARATAAVTRRTLRPVSQRLPPDAAGVAISRAIVAGAMATLGQRAPNTQVRRIAVPSGDGGQVRGEFVTAGPRQRDDAVLFYVHGSGYTLCSPRTHRRLVSTLAAATGLPVFSVDYRLAPRYRFPAAADDVARAFTWLTEMRVPPERVVAAGDSAGGHLLVDLCLSRQREDLPVPRALALLSPLVDLSLGLATRQEGRRADPMTSAAAVRRLLRHYLGDADPGHQRLNHVFSPEESLPPTLIQAGGAELLREDAEHLHARLEAVGADTTLEIWPGQMHVFQALPRVIPEARPAIDRIARFLLRHLDETRGLDPLGPTTTMTRSAT